MCLKKTAILAISLAVFFCVYICAAENRANTAVFAQGNIDTYVMNLFNGFFNNTNNAGTSPTNAKEFLADSLKKLSDFDHREKPFVIYQREDLARHFVVGINMGLTLNKSLAENIAHYKELSDTRKGGSGFDFNDFAATLYGVSLGTMCSGLSENEALKFIVLVNSGSFKITSFYPECSYPHLQPETIPAEKTVAEITAEIRDNAFKIISDTKALLKK